jgi:hypothetical protein
MAKLAAVRWNFSEGSNHISFMAKDVGFISHLNFLLELFNLFAYLSIRLSGFFGDFFSSLHLLDINFLSDE